MDELQKLYDVLVREGKYTKSFDEFKNKWSSDTDYQNQVFDVVSRDGLYTKDKQSFFEKYSGAAPTFEQPQVKKKEPTPSVSAVTPSVSQKLVKQSGRELTTDISKFQQDPTAPPIVLTEDGKKTYVAPEPTPKPEEKKFKYDEASFSKMVKGMQEYQQGKTKDIQDFADPRLSKVWNEIKDKQSKNYNDPIGNFSSAVIQKASDLVPKRVSDAWNKGLLQGEQANIVNLGFEEMTDEDANRLSRIEQELSTYTPSEEERKFAEGGFSWVINNPVDGAKFIGETILNSLASQIKASTRSIPQGIAVGAAAGAPIGGVGAIPGAIAGATAGTIMAGLNIETSQKILQSIKDAGFDLKNPEEIRQAFSDRDMIEKFRILGLKRGVPIAIIDVFTAGIAGKVAKGGSTLASSVARKGAGLGVEAIGGSAGEFAAQVSAGEKIDPNAIALEGIAEVGAGAPTLVTSTAYQGALERKNTSSSDKNIALQITANKVAGDEDARNHLKKLLSEGTIDEIEFKDGIKVIEESKVSDARIPDNIVGEARAESIVLMNRKTDVQNQIRELEGKKNMMDEVYHPEIDQQIEVLTKKTQEIDNELINIQKQNDAIQKQTTDESVLRTEQPQVGLQEVGKGDQVTEVITEEAKPKEEVVVALSDVKNTSDFITANNLSSEIIDKSGEFFPANPEKKIEDILSERYHEVKLDGSNPDLVKAVEDAVGKTIQTQQKPTEEAKPKEEVVFSNDKKLNNFLNELSTNGKLETNPINQREFIYNDGTSLELNRFDKGDKNEIVLQDINVLDKSKGEGSKVMKDITNTADKLGYKITLEAKPFGRDPKALDIENLVKFYEKNGFQIDMSAYGGDFNSREEFIDYAKENPSESIPMFREPSAVAEVVTEEINPDLGYEEEVKKYKWYVVDTENKKAVTGFEFKEDAKDALSDYDGDPNFKLVSKTSLGKYGIEDPTQKFISAGKNIDEEVADLETLLIANRFSSGYNEKYKKNAAQIENHRRLADLARKALAKIAPNVKIILHETTDSYDSAVPKRSQGAFITKTNTIHINLQYADVETVPHEVFHAILFIKIKTDRRATKVTKEMFESVKKVLDKDSPVYKQIEEVASNYDETLQDEERLAELFGILSVNYEKLPVPAKNAIVRFIEKIAKLFGLDATKLIGRTDNSVINLLNTLSEKVAKGEEIQESEIAILGVGGDGKRATLFRQANNINDIIKLARANGFSESAISTVLNNRGFSEQEITDALSKELGAKGTIEVTEELLPGQDELISKVDALIKRQQSKNVAKQKIAENVKKLMEKSDAYNNATDIQKEKLIRDANKKIGIRQKSAPSIDKLFGTLKDVTKITMTESKALVEQIKNKAKGAKEAKSVWRATSEDLSRSIKEAVSNGKITTKQAANIIRRFSKVDMFNTESIKKFVDYTQKVWNDAAYADKLSTAKSDKKDISKLSRNKDKNANLRQLGKKFSEIDPSMVSDIDKYNEVASSIKESLKGSKIVGRNIKLAGIVNIEEASKYIDDTMKAQREKLLQDRIDYIQELMGVDASEFSYEDMMKLLDPKEKINKDDEAIIRATINKMFDTYSTIIDSMLSEGKDVFTGEEFEVSKSKKETVKKFMDMDLNMLTPKQALEAVDALNNFIQNKSTAKMDAVVASYEGNKAAKELANSGVKAQSLKLYWNKSIGRFFGEQFTTLPILIERMFKGVTAGEKVQRVSGLTELINSKSKAERESNNIFEDYANKFFTKKANGKDFTSESNIIERGLVAFMSRNVIGTEEQVAKEFERRKKLVEESIDVLSKGSDIEKKKAELYQEAYDKVLKDSDDSKQVRDKAAKENVEAVDYWVDKWADKYDALADVSENVYNTILDKDTDYNPDRFSKLESTSENVNLVDNESAFLGNTNSLYKKETGVLMKAEKPTELPKSDNGKVDRYVDLSFDKNNSNSMYDALIDLNTAAPIRKIEGFLNSPDISRVIPEANDEKLLKERVKLYIRNLRNKNVFDNDEFSSMVRKLNTLSSIGVGQALGAITQPIKQVIPVAMNTLVNAGGLDMNSMFNADKNKFIDESGYAISNRGIESLTNISSVNKLIDLASQSKGQKALAYIEKANKLWLDAFLIKPDVFIARASWMTYYEKYLDSHGENSKDIDYKTHKINKEAADYAQSMVDRQQNTSDADLQGKIFSSKNPATQMIVKTVLPFANFRMNQTMRMMSDVSTLTSKTSSSEDKKIAAKSLSGFAVEMATFKLVAMGASILLGSITKMIMGEDESEEERKKRIDSSIKAQLTSATTDVLSPLPISDTPVAIGANFVLDKAQDAMDIADEDKLSLYEGSQSDAIKSLGTLGISASRAKLLYDLSVLSYTGKYKDSFGNEREISEKDRETLKAMVGVSLLTNVGLAPAEANTIATNAMKYAKQSKKKSNKNKETEKELLQGYDNRTDMKRYNPELYEQTFGKGSPTYEIDKMMKDIEKQEKDMEQQIKDATYGYTGETKKKTKKKK